ncbi:50S ribosomal protein L33 [Camelliibacillus cellulosilyticus]|uniref:Large ribosomal subunit protein bL33 n=1 Tax=Camelliibacillus cellulosilyticus TaxID=2174486 RepID=A0ABV9GQE4_9BACL
MRKKVILACSECHERNYTSTKNVQKQTERLAVKKFCGRCNKHTIHLETK